MIRNKNLPNQCIEILNDMLAFGLLVSPLEILQWLKADAATDQLRNSLAKSTNGNMVLITEPTQSYSLECNSTRT